MLQLHNTSPFVPALFGLPDARGVETLVLVVKGTFDLDASPRIAAQQRPIVLADEYVADPTASSLRYPSEVCFGKPGTDVIVLGHAHAPRGQAVTELDVGVRVGELGKHARVFGDRHWTRGLRGLEPSRPEPFVRMPLVYERSFGGGQGSARDPRNPVGVGFVGDRSEAEMLGLPVPNIEDPRGLLTALGQTPTPTGFAAIAPSWAPRSGFAGTYDERWQATRAPYLPDDFDLRYFQVASPGLSAARPLVGGELVRLIGFDPDGDWQLTLPRCRLDAVVELAGARERIEPVIDTLVIEPDARSFSITWRATLAVERGLLRVRRVELGLAELEVDR